MNKSTGRIGECWAMGEGPQPCKLERLFDLAPALLCIAGTDGYFKRVNPAFRATLGHSETELLSRPFADFLHPADRVSTTNEIAKLSAGIPAVEFENRCRHADGSYRWLTWSANPMAEEGLLFATALDVTKRRHLAARLVLAEEEERRRLAMGLHDNVGHALLEAKMSLDERQESDMPKLRRLLDDAIRMTRDLTIELAAPVLYDVGLGAALESECERVQERHGIRFQPPRHVKAVPPDERCCGGLICPPDQRCDPGCRLPVERRVVLFRAGRELIRNVVKHSKARTAKVSLSVSASRVQLTVEDDGCGFDTAQAARGVDANDTFGLFSITQGLELIGGRLEIASSPGDGTRAVVTAPLDAATEGA